MNNFLNTNFNWSDFIAMLLLLTAVYFGLKILKILVEKFNRPKTFRKTIQNFLHYALLVFEPAAALILTVIFILISPSVNGLLILLLLLGGFNYLKNYLAGRHLRRDNTLKTGNRLSVGNIRGVVYELERFGLQLQTAGGRHFVNYSKLFKEGYTILGGDKIGETLHLNIAPVERDEKVKYPEKLMNLFVSTPYIDTIMKPGISPSDKNEEQLDVRILVRDSNYISDLRSLLNEQGYSVKFLKSK